MAFTKQEHETILAGLLCLANDHKAAFEDANQRAADPHYAYRKEALEAAGFHAERRHQITLLRAKVQRIGAEIST
jgi:hypothetical protein